MSCIRLSIFVVAIFASTKNAWFALRILQDSGFKRQDFNATPLILTHSLASIHLTIDEKKKLTVPHCRVEDSILGANAQGVKCLSSLR
jgi:hypothetical protein